MLAVVEFVGRTPPDWVAAIQPLTIVGMVLGFLFVGTASLRTDTHPRLLGVLLFVPAVVFAVKLVRVAVLGVWTPSWTPFLLGSLQALAMLAIGYSLRAESGATERTEQPTDTAA